MILAYSNGPIAALARNGMEGGLGGFPIRSYVKMAHSPLAHRIGLPMPRIGTGPRRSGSRRMCALVRVCMHIATQKHYNIEETQILLYVVYRKLIKTQDVVILA